MTAELSALALRRVRVVSITRGVGEELVGFVDGTRIWLDVRDGSVALRCLAARLASQDVYLGRVEPCFGRCWYQLGFAGRGGTGPTVLARVTRYESRTTWICGGPGFRRRHRRGEQHPGERGCAGA